MGSSKRRRSGEDIWSYLRHSFLTRGQPQAAQQTPSNGLAGHQREQEHIHFQLTIYALPATMVSIKPALPLHKKQNRASVVPDATLAVA